MPIYTYKAKNGPLDIISGQIEANSRELAVDKINAMGLFPITVEEFKQIKNITSYSNPHSAFIRLKTKDIDIFTRQLSELIRANVPILRALSLISEQTENKILSRVVIDLGKEIKTGKTLSEAMAEYPLIFNSLYINMVRAGEKAGALYEVLHNLVEYRQKEEDIRQKIQAALAYPILIIVVGIVTVFVMLTFFLPKLTDLFGDMKQSLPVPTKLLIWLSEFMAHNWYFFLLAFVFLIVVFGRAGRGSKKKFLFDFIKLRIPFVEKFAKNSEIAKFTRTLSLLLHSGNSLYESFEFAADVLDNDALKQLLKRVKLEITDHGSMLSQSLKNINIFPLFAVNMIAVGEEGGKLDESLKVIADVYEREIEQAIKIMTTLLEPLLILVIGAIIGFIVFAMLLPVFNIGISVH